MESNNFSSQVTTILTAVQLRSLYDILDESQVPFEARIRKADSGRHVTIMCHEADLCYWQQRIIDLGGRL